METVGLCSGIGNVAGAGRKRSVGMKGGKTHAACTCSGGCSAPGTACRRRPPGRQHLSCYAGAMNNQNGDVPNALRS